MDNDTVAAAAQYLHEPEKNLVPLQGIYNLIESERPRIRQLAAVAAAAAMAPTGSVKAVRLQVSMLFSWGAILGFGSMVNHVLRSYVDDDSQLIITACDYYNEALDVAAQSSKFRPYGSGFVPDVLKAVWAGTADLMGGSEIEEIFKEYGNDVEGADHLGDAMYIKRRLELAGLRQYQSPDSRDSPPDDMGDQTGMGDMGFMENRCVVL